MNDFFRNLSFYLELPHSYEGGICRVSLKSESVNDDSCGDATLEPLNEMRGRCGADGCRMRGRWVPKGHQFAPQGSPWGAKGLHMAPHGEPNGSTWLPMGSQTAPLGPPWGAKRLHLAPQVCNCGPEGGQKAPLGAPRGQMVPKPMKINENLRKSRKSTVLDTTTIILVILSAQPLIY